MLASQDPISKPSNSKRIVLAITGASGMIYAIRLVQALAAQGHEIYLTVSPSGALVAKQELDLELDLKQFDPLPLLEYQPPWSQPPHPSETPILSQNLSNQIHYCHYEDYLTPIASGSFTTNGMVVCPCSGNTLSGIAQASAANLVQRAAEVHMKENRKLVVVPRETPCSVFQLENMRRLASAGVIVLPAMPGWYHGVRNLDDLVDFVVSRILDQLGIANDLIKRWGKE